MGQALGSSPKDTNQMGHSLWLFTYGYQKGLWFTANLLQIPLSHCHGHSWLGPGAYPYWEVKARVRMQSETNLKR